MNSSSSIDQAILESLDSLYSAEDKDQFNQILTKYLNSSLELIKSLRDALEGNNLKSVHDLSHRLKSSCMVIGAAPLSNMFSELEKITDLNHQPDAVRCNEIFSEIMTEYPKVRGELMMELEKRK